MLDKLLQGFPKNEAMQSTVATIVGYKGSKFISGMFAERFIKEDKSNESKRPMYEFVGSVLGLAGSVWGYKKIKNRNLGYGLVIGAGLNTIDKVISFPKIKEKLPDSMKNLFSGSAENDLSYYNMANYQNRMNSGDYTATEDQVKAIVNAARVNGFLEGYGDQQDDEFGSDVIVLTPEERSALLEENLNRNMGSNYDPYAVEYQHTGEFAGDGDDEEMMGEETTVDEFAGEFA